MSSHEFGRYSYKNLKFLKFFKKRKSLRIGLIFQALHFQAKIRLSPLRTSLPRYLGIDTHWHNSGTWYPSLSLNFATGTAIVISHPFPSLSNALLNSSTKYIKLFLSVNFPPRSAAPGYSQSKSNPWKLYLFINSRKKIYPLRQEFFANLIYPDLLTNNARYK